MNSAMSHLFEHRFRHNGQLYSVSGGEMSNPPVRCRLVADNAVIPLGRLWSRTDELQTARAKMPTDRYLACRILYRLKTKRLDEINRQLLMQKPKFSAKRSHTGQLVLDFGENEGIRPDFDWDQF